MGSFTRDRILIFLAVVAIVAGARFAVLQSVSSPSPYVDEWPGTAEALLVPAKAETLSAAALFAPHNYEHRIVLSRLWELFWFRVAGEWDPQLVMTANAVLSALTAGLLAVALGFDLGRRARAGVAIAVAAIFAVPFAYANLLWAFQAQSFFLLLTSLAALACAFAAHPNRWARVGAFALTGLALLTNGAGGVVGMTFIVVASGLALAGHLSWRKAVPWLICGGLSVAGAVALRPPQETTLSAAASATAFAQALAWPNSNLLALVARAAGNPHYLPAALAESSWLRALGAELSGGGPFLTALYGLLAVLTWWPLAAFALAIARKTTAPLGGGARFTLAAGVWSAGIAATMGLARTSEAFVGTRFIDFLLIGLLANGMCLVRLPARRWMSVAWFAVVGGGLAVTAAGIFGQQLPRKAAEGRSWARHVQAYVTTRDPQVLAGKQPNELPILSSNPDALRTTLDRPDVRAILPRGVQPVPPPASGVSRAAALLRASGLWWLAVGVALLGLAFKPQPSLPGGSSRAARIQTSPSDRPA